MDIRKVQDADLRQAPAINVRERLARRADLTQRTSSNVDKEITGTPFMIAIPIIAVLTALGLLVLMTIRRR